MKNLGVIVVVIIILVGVGCVGVAAIYPTWGRRIIYPRDSIKTIYPGFGQIIEKTEAQIMVTPKVEGAPFFDRAWMGMKYAQNDYEIVDIPAQDRLMYSVGKVVGWENIDDTPDKYLLLESVNAGVVDKYRISFGGEDETLLAMEDVSLRLGRTMNPISKYQPARVGERGVDELKKMIRVGDVVVVTPVLTPPDYAKRDDKGYYLALWLILRRVGVEL